jgi:hypothetical protein
VPALCLLIVVLSYCFWSTKRTIQSSAKLAFGVDGAGRERLLDVDGD